MFARQATLLLELACRVCQSSDPTGSLLSKFSSEINHRDPRYFWDLPGEVWNGTEFPFPNLGSPPPYKHILAAIFNLVRNGQAHQNQQIHATLQGSGHFCLSLTGAEKGFLLDTIPVLPDTRPSDHLSYTEHGDDIWLLVRTDVFFLDIRDAVRDILLEEPRTLTHLRERRFNFDNQALKNSLDNMNKT